jgi:hypothetical protein
MGDQMPIKKEVFAGIKELGEKEPNTWVYLIGDGKTVSSFKKLTEFSAVPAGNKIMGKMLVRANTTKEIELKNSEKKDEISPSAPKEEVRTYTAHRAGFQTFKGGKLASEADSWEVKLDCVTSCSKAPSEKEVKLQPIVKMKIDSLMSKYKNQEWLAYYVGPKDQYIVNDLVIPEQKASSAHVGEVEYSVPEGQCVVGVIHSHHSMFKDFSGTDDAWINQNHNISTVVTHTGSKTRCRVKTPCGSLIIVPGKLKMLYNVEFDETEFIKLAEEKINPPTTVYSQPAHGVYGPEMYGDYDANFFRNGGSEEGQKSSTTSPTSDEKTTEEVEKETKKSDETTEKLEMNCLHYMDNKGCSNNKITGPYCTYFNGCPQFENKNGEVVDEQSKKCSDYYTAAQSSTKPHGCHNRNVTGVECIGRGKCGVFSYKFTPPSPTPTLVSGNSAKLCYYFSKGDCRHNKVMSKKCLGWSACGTNFSPNRKIAQGNGSGSDDESITCKHYFVTNESPAGRCRNQKVSGLFCIGKDDCKSYEKLGPIVHIPVANKDEWNTNTPTSSISAKRNKYEVTYKGIGKDAKENTFIIDGETEEIAKGQFSKIFIPKDYEFVSIKIMEDAPASIKPTVPVVESKVTESGIQPQPIQEFPVVE